MTYEPGTTHEFYQNLRYYQSNIEFVISLLTEGKRHNDLETGSDYDIYLTSFDLEIGDIIEFRLFKDLTNAISYLYIENIIRNGETIPINLESLMSWDFIRKNTTNGCFTDMTKIFERDQKISRIISDPDKALTEE